MQIDEDTWIRFQDHCGDVDRSPKRLVGDIINAYIDRYEQEENY